MNERPVGHLPEAGRSDWTEQDLLTREEALPRLEEAIAQAETELAETADAAIRQALRARLDAMYGARQQLKRGS